jgi:hypothetical protein
MHNTFLAAFEFLDPFRTLLKVVAVVGGGVLGALVTGLLFSLIARAYFQQRPSRLMKRFVQLLGGLAVALAISKLPIGFGSGFGFGGGSGPGEGSADGSKSNPVASLPDDTPKPPQQESPLTESTAAEGAVVRIEMLGGTRVQDGKFYLIEGDNEPKTKQEVYKIIEDRLKHSPRPLKGVEIIVTLKSVARIDPAVTDLESWAKNRDLKVSVTNK